MTLQIKTFPSGPIDTNAYLVWDDASGNAIVVDAPPESVSTIKAAVAETGVKVTAVVLTHGHWDHIVDTEAIRQAFNAPVMSHPGVVARVVSPVDIAPIAVTPSSIEVTLDDGDIVTAGAHAFTVWFLPGHDEGHIALVDQRDKVFLGGDVLFPNGHGRTDIPGSDQQVMEKSLKRLLTLADDVTVYPGHGAPTTIGQERGWIEALRK